MSARLAALAALRAKRLAQKRVEPVVEHVVEHVEQPVERTEQAERAPRPSSGQRTSVLVDALLEAGNPLANKYRWRR